MTYLKALMIAFVLSVIVFHIIPQLPSGAKRIQSRAEAR